MTIEEVIYLDESEDKVEFKEAKTQFSYNNKRKSVLGYAVALANEGGGKLIFGIKENKKKPHAVCGSEAWKNNEGKLEQDIYNDLKVRVKTETLLEKGKRVLVIHVPSRPIGVYLTFEDVPLMRVGEELHPMSQDHMRSILFEQEGDFSAKFCPDLKMSDLDTQALEIMKMRYSRKQENDAFLSLSNEQVLSDLELLKENKLTYAALVLLAKKEKIKELLPQCEIRLEYRSNPSNIEFDNRSEPFVGPYFLILEDVWRVVNARNKSKKIQIDAYINEIHELNQEVIRESINNAVAHRDYTKASEIVIKQSPMNFSVSSHGGFPLGVTKQNILTVNSTPRNRLLTEVMTKTGLVERSGQGVDKIFMNTLIEGKEFPSYDESDLFEVKLDIPVIIKYPVFALFVKRIQEKLVVNERLGVHHLITLVKIREQDDLSYREKELLDKLEKVGAIKQNKSGVFFAEEYTRLVELLEGKDRDKIIEFVKQSEAVKMGAIIELFQHRLTRRQVNNMVFNLVDEDVLEPVGEGKGTSYKLKQ